MESTSLRASFEDYYERWAKLVTRANQHTLWYHRDDPDARIIPVNRIRFVWEVGYVFYGTVICLVLNKHGRTDTNSEGHVTCMRCGDQLTI